MATEIQSAKKWIADLLQGDATLTALIPIMNIFVDQAYRDLGFPYIVISYSPGVDVPGLGTVREMTVASFFVRVVTEGAPTDDDRSAEVRMDYLLQHAVNQTSGGFLFSSRRVQPIDLPEYDENKRVRYHSLGGIYRVWISPA